MSDPFSMTVASDSRLEEILDLACTWNKTVRGFLKKPDVLIFYWSDNGCTPLPVPMSGSELTTIVLKWLKDEAEYPEEPDIDGHCRRGFRITTEFDGYAPYYIFKVLPEWIIYHK